MDLGNAKPTRLASFQDKDNPKVDLELAKQYHAELDRLSHERAAQRTAERQSRLQEEDQVCY